MKLPTKILLTSLLWMWVAVVIGAVFNMPTWWMVPTFLPATLAAILWIWTWEWDE